MTVSDFILKRVHAWGIRRIYGYPGDGINGLMGAFDRLDGAMRFIQVRHEEMAAFMATADSKYTGNVACCMATSGPGAIHLLNGLYDAKMDHRPVVAIVGQAATTAIGGSYQQEVDLVSLFKDVAAEYVYQISSPTAARHIVDRAFRTAHATRSVTCIIVPKDVQEMDAVENPPHAANTLQSGIGYSTPIVVPNAADLRAAAEVLNAGKRVAMLIGAGTFGAAGEVVQVADRLQAGVAKALLGKAALPDDLPFVTGTLGLLGTEPSSNLMRECDTLLLVGTTYPYSQFLPEPGQARGVQIDIDERNLSIRYPNEVNLTGDSAATLAALLPYLEQKTDTSWRERIAENRRHWATVTAARAEDPGEPLNPQKVFAELSPRLPDNCILSGDAGTSTNWSARELQIRAGMKFSLSGSLATMGPAVPYAIAAKFCFPDRVAIGMTGDGAMQMGGNAELITVAKYWKTWADPRLIILVLNNRDLNQVTWEMRIESGDPKFEASQDLPDFPYAAYAQSLGLKGIRVDRPQDVGPAWEAALAADRPVVYEAYTDPNISIIPPHISFEQAKNFTSAMLKGDPDEMHVIGASVRSLVSGLLPHGNKR
jgi:pyruvate dehydrogenase (quinone)